MSDPTTEDLPRSVRGRFWFPEHPSLVLSGELTISIPHNYDLLLDLPHDGLNAPGYWESMIGKEIPVMLGITDAGRLLTCSDCGIYSSKASYAATHLVSWHKLRCFAHRCFLGAHITEQNEMRVQQFSSFFTGFSQWASDYDHELFSNGAVNDLTTLKRADVINGFGQLKIWRAGSGNVSISDVGKRVEIRYWRPSFEPSQPILIDEMLDTVRDFQRLLSLLQGRAVGFNDLRAEMLEANGGNVEPKVYDVETMVMMPGYKETFRERREFDVLLPLHEIAECWPMLVSRWLRSSNVFAAPLNLYFAVLFAGDLFDEHKFLFLAQALEGYHRCKFKCDVKFLRRLTELTNPHRDTFSIFIRDVPLFLETVRDTRDELTHPGLGKVNLVGLDLHALWRQLKATFEICVLSDFGVPSVAFKGIVRECSEWIDNGCNA
jgi:hypothetical protein